MIIDVLVIGLLILGAWLGWKKGLVRMISGWMGWLLVPYIAFRFAGSLGEILNKSFGVTGKIAAFLVHHPLFLKIGALINLIVTPLDFFMEQIFGKGLAMAAADAPPAALAESLAKTFVYLLCFFFLFFAAKWGLRLVANLITRGLDHTIIGAVNHFCGGALSAGATFIAVAIILMITARMAAGGVGDGGVWDFLHRSFDQASISGAIVQVFRDQVSTWVKI